jgi:hypothetical protein
MMAATVIVVAFFGMISAVTSGSEMMATARRQTLASKLMDHELEQLRLESWTTIDGYAAGPTTITIDDTHPFYAALQGSGATFTLTRSVAAVSGLTNVKEVTFSVSWTVKANWKVGGASPTRTYTRTKSGYYSKYGLNLTYQRA